MWFNYSKANIQAGYRNSSWIVNCWCVDKTFLNYGADTHLSIIIAHEIPRLYLNKFNRKYPGRLLGRNLKFENCKQQLFTLTTCLPACLWGQISRTPLNYTITAWTLLAKCDDYQSQGLILQFPALAKKLSYRKHHSLSSKSASSCLAKRKWFHVL